MNVKELKDEIKDLPDDMEVILQKDSEGNGYFPLRGANSDAIYIPILGSTCGGLVYDLKWSAKEACMGEKEWQDLKVIKLKALILYPVD